MDLYSSKKTHQNMKTISINRQGFLELVVRNPHLSRRDHRVCEHLLTYVDGVEYKGITNYGTRPTFDNERVLTETYLDGFDGDLYGKILTVQFIKYLRDVKKFNSVEDLKEQLQKDIRRVRDND